MSEVAENKNENSAEMIKLNALYARKVGMSSVYTADGELVPVTVLKMGKWIVSQIKTTETDGYNSIQIASEPKKASRTTKAEKGHLKAAGFENGAKLVKEVRQDNANTFKVGQQIDIQSLQKGDVVKMTATSKGRGFAGSVKRHGFAGGPASHGSKFHRQPGSSGNRTWPGRVMPGKRFPGHLGSDTVTVKNVNVVEVLPEENLILVKGPVPGSRNSLVKLLKE